jgi:hypothetical protein
MISPSKYQLQIAHVDEYTNRQYYLRTHQNQN